MNRGNMYPPEYAGDQSDADLDAMLSTAGDQLLAAIQANLDLDAGLAEVIGNPPLTGATGPEEHRQPTVTSKEAARMGISKKEAFMLGAPAIEIFAGHTEPDPDPDDSILEAQAHAALKHWLQDHPAIAGEIKETARARIHLRELQERADEAGRIAQDAEHRAATLATELDPPGRRMLGFAPGAALVFLLVVLDVVPFYWAAQAFGFDSAGTWLVTFILVVASFAAMLGFKVTRGHRRQRGLLAAGVAAGYIALLELRTVYLTTVATKSFPVAFLQAAMVTAISAGLVLCGSAALARTRSLTRSSSHASARRARQAAAEAAQKQAAEKLERHIGGLRQMILPWALSVAAPVGVDRARWAAALERAICQLFPVS